MKYIISILIIFYTISGLAQSYNVYVVDENNQPVPYVASEINYIKNSKKESVQTMTNVEGILLIDSTWKEVRLKLKHIGFQTRFTSISIKENRVILYSDEMELTTFVVTGQYLPSSDEKSVHKVKVIDSNKSKSILTKGKAHRKENKKLIRWNFNTQQNFWKKGFSTFNKTPFNEIISINYWRPRLDSNQ